LPRDGLEWGETGAKGWKGEGVRRESERDRRGREEGEKECERRRRGRERGSNFVFQKTCFE